MNTKNYIETLALMGLGIIVAGVVGFSLAPKPAPEEPAVKARVFGVLNNDPFRSFATSSQVTVTTSSTIVSASSTRAYGIYTNSGSNPIYLCLTGGRSCSAATASIYLGTGAGYEIFRGENEYEGAITAIASGGNSTLNLGENGQSI